MATVVRWTPYTELASLQPGQRAMVDPYLLLNATITWNIPVHPPTSLQLGAYNLLDSEIRHPLPSDYSPLSTYRESGRTFRLTLGSSF